MRVGCTLMLALSFGLVLEAAAQSTPTLFHVTHDTFGCINPRATTAITNRADPRQTDPGWVNFVIADGQCAPITPKSTWRLVFHQGVLAYMTYAGTTGLPGSFYIKTDQLVEIAPVPSLSPAQLAQTTNTAPVVSRTPEPSFAGSVVQVPASKPQSFRELPPALKGPKQTEVPSLDAFPPPGNNLIFIDQPPTSRSVQAVAPAARTTPMPRPTDASGPILFVVAVFGISGFYIWQTSSRSRTHSKLEVIPNRLAPTRAVATRSPYAAVPSKAAPFGKKASEPAAWYPPGAGVAVAGFLVRDGMVYVGAISTKDKSTPPCFIDPGLEVANAGPDTAGSELAYWPSYAQITPRCRLAYLQWLAGGKSDHTANIGYVFLYFYGLERRLLVDGADGPETAAIVVEIRRLRSIYERNNSFNNYCAGLLDAADVIRRVRYGSERGRFQPDLAALPYSMPLALKLALGIRVANGEPLPFELAMAGLIGLDRDRQSVSGQVLEHARPQFLQLMRPVFEKAYPTGFSLAKRKDSTLHLMHRCATAGLQVDLGRLAGSGPLPDASTLTWTKLSNSAAPVSAKLEEFAKLKAYRPARADSLSVFAALPDGLAAPAAVSNSAKQAKEWLYCLPKPIAKIGFGELAQQAIGENSAKWTLRHHRAVGDALAATAYGLEPYPAEGGLTIANDTAMFVFPDTTASRGRSKSYQAAAVGAEVVIAVAQLYGAAASSVRRTWLDRIGERLPMEPCELIRLEARLKWLEGTKPNIARIKAGLASTSAINRDTVAWSAAAAAAAGGMVSKEQVSVLEKVYDTLGLGRRDLYAALHSAAAARMAPATDPVQISSGGTPKSYAIPQPPAPIAAPVPPGELDPERIRIIKAETERISAVLADIFDEEEAQPMPASDTKASGPFPGLEGSHAALLGILRSAAAWDRADFDREVRGCGLLPDGALETINEWAFDHFDEPVIEEGDNLAINIQLLAGFTMEAHAG